LALGVIVNLLTSAASGFGSALSGFGSMLFKVAANPPPSSFIPSPPHQQ